MLLNRLNKLFIAASLSFACATSFSATHNLSVGQTLDLDFPSKALQSLSNPLPWSVTVACKVTSQTTNATAYFEMKKGSGSINNMPLSKGDTVYKKINTGDAINVTAGKYAEINITNLSDATVKLKCNY